MLDGGPLRRVFDAAFVSSCVVQCVRRCAVCHRTRRGCRAKAKTFKHPTQTKVKVTALKPVQEPNTSSALLEKQTQKHSTTCAQQTKPALTATRQRATCLGERNGQLIQRCRRIPCTTRQILGEHLRRLHDATKPKLNCGAVQTLAPPCPFRGGGHHRRGQLRRIQRPFAFQQAADDTRTLSNRTACTGSNGWIMFRYPPLTPARTMIGA